MRWVIVVLAGAGLLGGCDDSRPPQKTVFDPYVQSLKKAKGVEQKYQEAEQRRREELERQEQQGDK